MSETRPTRGRRIAAPPPRERRGLDRTTVVAAALVLLSAAAVLVAGRGEAPPAQRVTADTEPVDHVVDGCARTESGTSVVTGSAPVAGLGGQGSVRYAAPAALASAKDRPMKRGALHRLDPGTKQAPTVAVEANGEIAAGLFTFQLDPDAGKLAIGDCSAPQAQWWFTGAGATLDHASELAIANVDSGPAVVDVRVFTHAGEATDTVGTRGITVQPGDTLEVPLMEVVPQGDDLAVSVSTSRGRVVAAMSDSFAPDADASSGSEWMPAQSAPTRLVRLAGLPEAADTRTLVVSNPTDRETLLGLEVSGKTGSFEPTGLEEIRVPPKSVVTTDVGAVLGGEAVAVILRSPVPVTASLRSTAGEDSTYAAPVLPLTGPAAAPVADGARSDVVLTADSSAASAEIVAYDEKGKKVGAGTLELDPGATASWRPGRGAAYVVVTPREGEVFGGVSVTGAGTSQVPLVTLPVEVSRPFVQPALR